MVLVGTTLYLVGDFTKVNGTARKRAAAVSTDADGSLDPNFQPSLTNKVYAVAAGGGKHLLRRQLHLGHRHGRGASSPRSTPATVS